MSPERAERVLSLLQEPAMAGQLSAGEAASILAELAPVQSALAARIQFDARVPREPANASEPSRLLTPQEAADRMGVTKRWVHRHSRELAFARHLGRKTLRFWGAWARTVDARKKALNYCNAVISYRP